MSGGPARILLIGAGGHARVVADILLCCRREGQEVELLGFLDDNPAVSGKEILGFPVLGGLEDVDRHEHDALIIAIGNCRIRQHLYTSLKARGHSFHTAIHPSAVIAADSRIGEGCMVCAGAIVNTGSVVGVNTILNTCCSVDHDNKVGDHVHIAPGVRLGGNVSVGAGSLVGIGAVVMPQTSVGEECSVGSGAVVHRSLPGGVVAVGVPARVIRSRPGDGSKRRTDAGSGDFIDTGSSRWKSALQQTAHDFYHLPDYLDICGRAEEARPVAFLGETAEALMLTPLLLRPIPADLGMPADWQDASSPYGYPSPLVVPRDSNDCVRQMLKIFLQEAQRRNIVSAFIRLHPLLTLPMETLGEFGEVVRHGRTVYMDLSLSDEEGWRQTKSRHRRHINALKRQGFRMEMNDWSRFKDFRRIYKATMERVGASSYYYFDDSYFEDLHRSLGERLHLCTILSPDNKVAAAGLFTTVSGIVEYHLGGTAEEFLDLAPSKLMFHGLRRWGREAGLRVLHLGGGLGGREDALYHFKSGFSPSSAAFQSLRVIIDPEKYQVLCERRMQLSGARPAECGEAYFPAYRLPPAAGKGV